MGSVHVLQLSVLVSVLLGLVSNFFYREECSSTAGWKLLVFHDFACFHPSLFQCIQNNHQQSSLILLASTLFKLFTSSFIHFTCLSIQLYFWSAQIGWSSCEATIIWILCDVWFLTQSVNWVDWDQWQPYTHPKLDSVKFYLMHCIKHIFVMLCQ
jgi:hypothetical protein